MLQSCVFSDLSTTEAKDHLCQDKFLEQWGALNRYVAVLKQCSEWKSTENLQVGG